MKASLLNDNIGTHSGVAMGYVAALLITGIATALCSYASAYLDHSNLVMIYLLCIVYIATRFGRGPSILASLLSVAEFDYFCVKPLRTFAVSDWQYIITFTVMLAIAILITTLTSELQAQAELGRLRERRTEALRAFSTDLSLSRGRDKIVEVSLRHIRICFDAMVAIYLPEPGTGALHEYTADQGLVKLDRPANEVALWVFEHKESTGFGKGPFAAARSIYLPLIASQGVVGVLQVSLRGDDRSLFADDLELLETFANHTALCMEVAALSEQTQKTAINLEREQLRNVLLSSVSHDLRTPLATITGASSSLVEGESTLDEEQKKELAAVILEEADHLNNLVRNLLEMTKLESGAPEVKKHWHSVEELIGSAMNRLERHMKNRHVYISLPYDLPLVPLDDVLMQQVILNLLENVLKYTAPETDIDIGAHLESADPGANDVSWMNITVADRGPGLKPGEEEKIFTKFYRSAATSQNLHLGVGLGLAICRAIINAHGGTIIARNREGGGSEFIIKLPLEGEQPSSIMDMVAEKTADAEVREDKKA